MKRISLIAFIAIISNQLVAGNITALPYISHTDYGKKSNKKEAVAVGFYGSYYHDSGNKIEFEVKKNNISYYRTNKNRIDDKKIDEPKTQTPPKDTQTKPTDNIEKPAEKPKSDEENPTQKPPKTDIKKPTNKPPKNIQGEKPTNLKKSDREKKVQDDKPKLDQKEFTLVYSKYFDNYIARIGFHYIDSANKVVDETSTYIFGLRYKKSAIDYGIDFYYSDYKNNLSNLKVYQLSPYYKFNFWQKSKFGNFSLKTTYNFISPDSDDTSINDKHSLGIELENSYNQFTTTLETVFGKEMFAIKDNGFTIFEQQNLYKNSYSIALKYDINKHEYIKVKALTQKFIDKNRNVTSTSSVGKLVYGFKF